MKTEAEIISRHAVAVRPRARMEMQIVNALIKRAEETGNRLHILDSAEDGDAPPDDVRAALFDLDIASVQLETVATGERWGWIFLVFGNDGWDLVSDYSLSVEEFLAPVNALADRLEESS